jgi:hypothetical protein
MRDDVDLTGEMENVGSTRLEDVLLDWHEQAGHHRVWRSGADRDDESDDDGK